MNNSNKNIALKKKENKEIYFIKEGIVYSNKTTTIKFIEIDEIIDFDNSLIFPKSNEEIIKKLEEFISKNTKKIEISGKIENFNTIKQKILKNKTKFKKPNKNDFNFIAKTSQIPIIQNLIETLQKQHFKNIEVSINKILKENYQIENRKNNSLKLNIEKNLNKIQEFQNEIKNFQSKSLRKTQKEIITLSNEISALNTKKEIFEKELTQDIKESSKIILNFEQKIETFNIKIEKIKFKEELLEIKIKKLQELKKNGKKKHINPIIFIITLGIIYWLEYSNIDYKINSLKIKKLKLEEKKLTLNQKIKEIKQKIKQKEKEKRKKKEEINKKNEELLKKISSIDEKIAEFQKKLSNKKKEEEKKKEKINLIEKKILKLKQETQKLKELEKKYELISYKNIKSKIEKLRKNNLDLIKTLKEYLKSINEQKVENIKEEYIIEL